MYLPGGARLGAAEAKVRLELGDWLPLSHLATGRVGGLAQDWVEGRLELHGSMRDIAAAAGMQSGSPFYHFKSKDALLYAVMEEGMHTAIARQTKALQGDDAATGKPGAPLMQMRRLIRSHFDTLLGPGNDFVPVMLYEHRSLSARQLTLLAKLQAEYEAAWTPVLEALHASGHLRAPVKFSRLLILGALNWSVQWFDRKKDASLDDLTDAAMALFLKEC